LLFLAYQTSIVNQFEHVTQHWLNNPDHRERGSGFDPFSSHPLAERRFRLAYEKEGKPHTEDLLLPDKPFVLTTGGGYFFVPSIEALRDTLSK
jgi:deferrochelatase/peroxidase EfeB